MQEKFASFIVKNKWVFVTVFIVLVVLGGIMIFQNKVVYDLSQSAPKNSLTQDSVAILKREFDDKGSAYIMVKGVTQDEALTILDELNQMDGVAFAAFDKEKDYKNAMLYLQSP